MIVRVTGSSGEPFGANYGNLSSACSVEGIAPTDYEVRTEPSSGDYVAATAWKSSDNRKELKAQVLVDGKVVKETSTSEDYGAASVRRNPVERIEDGNSTDELKS